MDHYSLLTDIPRSTSLESLEYSFFRVLGFLGIFLREFFLKCKISFSSDIQRYLHFPIKEALYHQEYNERFLQDPLT